MKHLIWVLVIVLLVLHQDNWLWENDTLVFGFMPIGLLSQAGVSFAASIVWLLAVVFAWPSELEYDEQGDQA